jgi:carboxylesterase type B
MAHLAPERGEFMNKVHDLEAVFAQLRALAARGDIEPRQKQLVEQVIERLKRFRRSQNPNKAEIFRCVRDVAEKLLEAFLV